MAAVTFFKRLASMNVVPFYLFFQLATIVLWPVNSVFAETQAEIISLQAGNFEHIQFKKITPSRYSRVDDMLKIEVDSGSSFLMKAFDTVQEVNKVSFDWRSDGKPEIKNSKQEEEKKGDDAVFKMGLLLEANDEPFFNPLLPSWMKHVRQLLKFPSENMIYLVAGAKHTQNSQWLNPYNKRVTMISVSSVDDQQGWMNSSYQFKKPAKVVAIWLMADGDNTGSSFTSYVKGIKLE